MGPSTYDHLDAFKSLTKLPCYTLIVSRNPWLTGQKQLDIPKEELKHYKYVGSNLMYDPDNKTIAAYQLEPGTKRLVKGTGGMLVHPSL